MANIEVLLRENVGVLGKCGDVVRVKPGYARNFLFPNKLATDATPENKKLMARRRVRLDQEETVRNAAIDERVTKLTSLALACAVKADEHGHLFGSVNAATIAEMLVKAGYAAEERDVRLEAPLKTVGVHVVRIHVHGERFVDLNLTVNREA
jgi:large subunit ribosomal protein L9